MRLFEIEETENLLEKYKDEVNFALDKCIQYNVSIFRGSYTYNQVIQYTDPTSRSTSRVSAMDIGNYYTVWMDNDPKWSQFPKRGKSLICSSYPTNFYGNSKVVVPLIDTKIGVCPESDIWKSFKTVFSLGDFSDWLKETLFKNINHDPQNITYPQLINMLEDIDISELHLPYVFLNVFKKEMLDAPGTSGVDMMNVVLDPIKNNFILTTWKELNHFNSTHEVWLSAPCLLINPTIFSQLVDERKNATL